MIILIYCIQYLGLQNRGFKTVGFEDVSGLRSQRGMETPCIPYAVMACRVGTEVASLCLYSGIQIEMGHRGKTHYSISIYASSLYKELQFFKCQRI